MTDLDLVGIKEIAAMLDVHYVTVHKWRREGNLPPPDHELPRRAMWRRDTILGWAAETGRTVVKAEVPTKEN